MANSRKSACLGVIPARYASTRLPAKPLKDIAGKTLIQRVWEQASKSKLLDEVAIATDDPRIFDTCSSFGATVYMTADTHLSGSDRATEVLKMLEEQGQNFDILANIQGDMPFINPQVIDDTVSTLQDASSDIEIATIGTPIYEKEEFLNPAAVKIVIAEDQSALYFSRAPIPFSKDYTDTVLGIKHLGLYVYRTSCIKKLASIAPSSSETRESLEQLRALAHGIKIKVNIAERELLEPAIEVDTPQDLERAIRYALSTSND